MPPSSFPIQPFRNPSGETVYRVSGHLGPRRIRRNFRKKSEAERFQRRCRDLSRDHDTLAQPVTTFLTPREVRQAERAFGALQAAKRSEPLDELVRAALRGGAIGPRKAASGSLSWSQAVDAMVGPRERLGRSLRTTSTLRSKLAVFRQATGIRLLSDLTPELVRDYLQKRKVGLRTLKNDLAALQDLSRWAAREGHLESDRLANLEKVTVEPKRIVFLAPPEAQRLMQCAFAWRDGLLFAYHALSLFAGLRPEADLPHLTWAQVNLEGSIRVERSKTRTKRLVAVRPVLRKALQHAREEGLPLCPRNARLLASKFRKKHGFRPWVPDVMRHTFGTMLLADTSDLAFVADQMGNSPRIVLRDYAERVEKEVARQFWEMEIAYHR